MTLYNNFSSNVWLNTVEQKVLEILEAQHTH